MSETDFAETSASGRGPAFSIRIGLIAGGAVLTIFSWTITGSVCGWAAGKILAGHGYGAAVDITLGIAGAMVSGLMMWLLVFQTRDGSASTILVATLGAVLATGGARHANWTWI